MKNTRFLIQAAVIAAVYAVLTIMLMPFSYGPMQVRVSEALTVLPFFTPAAIPGLFVGCIVSNMVGPYGLVDMVLGSSATLIAAVFSYLLRKRPILVPLPPVVSNGIIVGAMLKYAYSVPMPLYACILWVAAGELVACYLIGYPLLRILKNIRRFLSCTDAAHIFVTGGYYAEKSSHDASGHDLAGNFIIHHDHRTGSLREDCRLRQAGGDFRE